MSQGLRALGLLPEALGSIPNSLCNSMYRRYCPLLASSGTKLIGAHTYMQANYLHTLKRSLVCIAETLNVGLVACVVEQVCITEQTVPEMPGMLMQWLTPA